MLFNLDKCMVMHFGYNNTLASYHTDNTVLPSCSVEHDLGILIHDNLKVSEQSLKAANTANRILGMMNRTFVLTQFLLHHWIAILINIHERAC